MAVHSATDLYPSKKVLFADARNVWDYIRTPLNPEQIPIDLTVSYGELNPIGWSQSLPQYSHTKSASFDVSLQYTMQTAERAGLTKADFEKGYAFYLAFCYPKRRGVSPSELMIVIPNTFAALCLVERCRISFLKWTVVYQIREYRVDLSLKFAREAFRESHKVRRLGYSGASDRKLASGSAIQLARLANTPLKHPDAL